MSCREYVPPFDHKCYLKPPRKKKTGSHSKPRKIWYADFEAIRNKTTGEQKANLLVLQSPGDGDAFEQLVYSGETCAADYVRDMCQKNSKFENSYHIYQNGGGYDFFFILTEFLKRGQPPSAIFRGQHILTMKSPVNNIEFRDACQYWGRISLSKLPGMYGIEHIQKGEQRS
jgi:hypothetical protein